MLNHLIKVVKQSLLAGKRQLTRSEAAFRLKQLWDKSGDLKLDLGAGGPGRRGTIGVDLHPNADMVWDLTRGIPCDDDCVSAIFSDHFLEHLSLVEVVQVLKECHRVLKPGGRLRFTVPHIDPYIDAWLRGDAAFIASKITDIPQSQESLYGTPFDRISWLLLRDGEHRALFDRESILHKVKLAGFEQVNTVKFDLDVDQNPRFSSVYVEAIK